MNLDTLTYLFYFILNFPSLVYSHFIFPVITCKVNTPTQRFVQNMLIICQFCVSYEEFTF